MQIAFERESFLRALVGLEQTTLRRTTIPILTCIRFDASNPESVTARTTNFEQQTTIQLSSTPGTPGAPFCTPCRDLLAWARARPDGALISLSRDGESAPLVASSGEARALFSTLPADDLPLLFDGDNVTARITLPATRLLDAIEQTRLAVSTETTRFYLNGIHISRDFRAPHNLLFVATDGHRLARTQIAMETDVFRDVIAPTAFIDALAPLLKKGPRGAASCTLAIGPKMIRAQVNGLTLDSILVDGTFPDWRRVIPDNNDRIAIFDGAALARIITPAAKATKATKATKSRTLATAVRLAFRDGRLTVTRRDVESGLETVDSISADYNTEFRKFPEIGFDPRYLLDMLKTLPGGLKGAVTGCFADAGSPALFFVESSPETRHVVMPVRI